MIANARTFKSDLRVSHAGAFHVMQVVTIPEASRLFGKSDATIRRALDRIPFRQSGTGAYLLSLPALKEIFQRDVDVSEIFFTPPRKRRSMSLT